MSQQSVTSAAIKSLTQQYHLYKLLNTNFQFWKWLVPIFADLYLIITLLAPVNGIL
jgi:hypothetical protein